MIPDAVLFALVLASPRRAPRLLLATLAGTTLGGSATLAFAALAPHAALDAVLHVPLVHARSVPAVVHELQHHALLPAFLYQPWSGVPFKLWAVLAPATGHAPLAVVPCFVAGRALRFAAVAAVAALLGLPLRSRLQNVAVPLLLLTVPPLLLAFYTVAVAG